MSTRNRLAVLAVMLLAVLAGCGQGRLPAAPIQRENQVTVGEPVLSYGADTIGFDALFNAGSKPAVIENVVIVNPDNISLLGAYITPGTDLGNYPQFPPAIPAKGNPKSAAWTASHKAAGAVIPPHALGGLALGLAVTHAAAWPAPTCTTGLAQPSTSGAAASGSSSPP